jgi:LuxR family transcriptional regulator
LSQTADQAPLTRREIEILQLIADGHTYAEISAHLRISTNTVKKYTGDAYARLRARSRGHAIATAIREGIIH